MLRSLVTTYREKKAALDEVFTEDILNLDDLSGLTVRFESVHKGLGKVKAQYRRDKALLRPCTRARKVNRGVISSLRMAVEWQRLTKELADAEQTHSAILGSYYYRHTETNFDAVTSAIELVERALTVAGEHLDAESLKKQLGRGGNPDLQIPSIALDVAHRANAWKEHALQVLPEFPAGLLQMPLRDLIDWCAKVGQETRLLMDAIGQVEATKGAESDLEETQVSAQRRAMVETFEEEVEGSLQHDRAFLGSLYSEFDTDWGTIQGAIEWTSNIRNLCGASMTPRVAQRLLGTELLPEELRTRISSWDKVLDHLVSNFLTERAEELRSDLGTAFQEAIDLLEDLKGSIADIGEWAAFVQHRDFLSQASLESVVGFCVDQKVQSASVPGIFERAVLEGWIDGVMKTDSRVRTFRAYDRDHYVQEFRELDRTLVATSVNRVIEACNQRRPRTTVGAAGIIQNEANKKRRHRPIRTLLGDTTLVTQSLKPCFMMSPLTVSQFLPPSLRFDVVIFDEASQVRPSDSINCVYRGNQLIVAGDQKQLPPTAFFEKVGLDEGDEYVEDQLEEFESILDLCKGSGGMTSLSLRWHYRSQHESLITFSNYSFYEGRLITFPSATEEAPDVGVTFFKADGIYRRGGPRDNPLEAVKVVERVLHHARTHPDLSVGVVAFSEAQAGTIEMELEKQRLSHPELDAFFGEDRLNGFFVKNLENVQGDERDIIIFSVGYGYDEAGKFTLQFGPINKAGGHRRLNVAVTRARRRVEVVASVTAGDFRGDLAREGVRHLKRYLDYAERGLPALALDITPSGSDVESPFEASVAGVIRSWGFDVVPQVGVADYRIDLGVRDPNHPGNFALGIECDGVMYHSSKVARDRDRLRQEVLEGLGWRLHRIWGTAWYSDRAQQESRLRNAIEDAIATQGKLPLRRDPRMTDGSQPELEAVSLDETPTWAVTYQVSRDAAGRVSHPSFAKTQRHWLEMHDPAAKPELRRVIERVVAIEGPVAEELVLRRVREAWGIGRAGSRVREAFNAALSELLRANKIIRDGEGFLWMNGQVLPGVRVASTDPDTRRAVSEVSRAELELAVRKVVSDARFISWEELSTYVARLFGWTRKGPDISMALDEAIEDLVQGGALRRNGDNLEPSSITDVSTSGTEAVETNKGIVICPSCGRENEVPKGSSGGLRCGECHSPLPS
ncbi:MAG: DUF3320 domain-containing protein [Actinobacteria bacterium]|nr:DUF3320 domain-containing protein [Actinomycetota bacterium]